MDKKIRSWRVRMNPLWHLTPELSRTVLRPRRRDNVPCGAVAAKRSRLERIVSARPVSTSRSWRRRSTLGSVLGRPRLDQRSAACSEAARSWPAETRKPHGTTTSGGAAALAVPPQLVALNPHRIEQREAWNKPCGRRNTGDVRRIAARANA